MIMNDDVNAPLPKKLAKQWGDDPPLMLNTYTVATLLEHWGFTGNGVSYVKKLVRCGTLVNVMKPGNNWRFETGQVMRLWGEMRK